MRVFFSAFSLMAPVDFHDGVLMVDPMQSFVAQASVDSGAILLCSYNPPGAHQWPFLLDKESKFQVDSWSSGQHVSCLRPLGGDWEIPSCGPGRGANPSDLDAASSRSPLRHRLHLFFMVSYTADMLHGGRRHRVSVTSEFCSRYHFRTRILSFATSTLPHPKDHIVIVSGMAHETFIIMEQQFSNCRKKIPLRKYPLKFQQRFGEIWGKCVAYY